MNRRKKIYALAFVGMFGVLSPASIVAQDDIENLMELGEQHYSDFCAACHGATGRGDVGPALASNERLSDDEQIFQQIAVGGGEMPGFDSVLGEEDIQAVATYIRNSWGNDFGPLAPIE